MCKAPYFSCARSLSLSFPHFTSPLTTVNQPTLAHTKLSQLNILRSLCGNDELRHTLQQSDEDTSSKFYTCSCEGFKFYTPFDANRLHVASEWGEGTWRHSGLIRLSARTGSWDRHTVSSHFCCHRLFSFSPRFSDLSCGPLFSIVFSRFVGESSLRSNATLTLNFDCYSNLFTIVLCFPFFLSMRSSTSCVKGPTNTVFCDESGWVVYFK